MKKRKIIDESGREINAAVTHENYTPAEHLGRGAMLYLRDGAFEVVGIDHVAGVETLKVQRRLEHGWEHLRNKADGPSDRAAKPTTPALLEIIGLIDGDRELGKFATGTELKSRDLILNLAKGL
jgi:hypothetical protein